MDSARLNCQLNSLQILQHDVQRINAKTKAQSLQQRPESGEQQQQLHSNEQNLIWREFTEDVVSELSQPLNALTAWKIVESSSRNVS